MINYNERKNLMKRFGLNDKIQDYLDKAGYTDIILMKRTDSSDENETRPHWHGFKRGGD